MVTIHIDNWIRGFFKKQVCGRTGNLIPELSEIFSEVGTYKSLVTSGVTTLMTLASQKVFHARTVGIDNQAVTSQIILFADGAAITSNPKMSITVGPNETVVVTDMKGILFTTYVTVDPQKAMGASGDCKVWIGGIYRPADGTL